jgi:hypothetical protein
LIDERRAHGLQAMYHAGAAGALQPLQEACAEIAQRITTAKVRRLRLPFSHDRIKEIAHDASSGLVSRFLDDPGFRVKRFSKMLGYRVQDELFVSPRQRQKTFEARVLFKDSPLESCAETVPTRETDSALELAESHRWGKKAVADLCRARSYRQAIKRIAAYVERRWIYDHADALHEVYRALHAKKGKDGSVSRSGLAGVRRSLLQGRRDQHEPAGK